MSTFDYNNHDVFIPMFKGWHLIPQMEDLNLVAAMVYFQIARKQEVENATQTRCSLTYCSEPLNCNNQTVRNAWNALVRVGLLTIHEIGRGTAPSLVSVVPYEEVKANAERISQLSEDQ